MAANVPSHRRVDGVLLFLVLATAAFMLARIPLIPLRVFDPDEFEHVHAAWCLSRGMIPYRDFFEHHTPWYYFMLSPFFHGMSVDTSFESARHFLSLGRSLSLLLTAVSAVLIGGLGGDWRGRKVGGLAALFLVGQPVFFEKTMEMRPDVLAQPFLLGALWLLLRGMATSAERVRRRHFRLFAGGLCLGAAIMCTQKMLFILPGLLTGLGLWSLWLDRVRPRDRIARLLSTVALLLGMAVPALATWLRFSLHHAGGAFITNNFLLNAKWKTVPGEQLLKLLATSWPMLVLCLLGAAVSGYGFFRVAPRRYGGFLLLGILLGLIAGILVAPVAHRQYYLMILPIACLFAAHGLVFLVEQARPRARPWLLVLATVPLSILPVLDVREAFTQRNDQQLERLAFVFNTTQPTDRVMDGWEGTGVFRPHAFYYYFLHDELLGMLPREDLDAYLDDLESGRIVPQLIAMDERLRMLGSRFVRFVYANYDAHDELFYVRKHRR